MTVDPYHFIESVVPSTHAELHQIGHSMAPGSQNPNRTEGLLSFLQTMWSTITIEPVVVLFCIIGSISSISSEVLYLQKGCQVNLNQSRAEKRPGAFPEPKLQAKNVP